MGFGFNILFVFIIFPLTVILLLLWLLTKKKIFAKLFLLIYICIGGIITLAGIVEWLTSKKQLKKKDYYGQYIVNRNYFKGRQADWQYNTFRFEIKDNDSIYFFITDRDNILKTYKGIITTTDLFSSERLKIKMEEPVHHILTENPTTYRSTWSFYLVFYSPKFNNMFFKKGKWKPLDN